MIAAATKYFRLIITKYKGLKHRMKKIKILQFPLSASFGGVTHYILNVWNQIDRQNFTFDFLTFSKELFFEKELIEQGSRVFHFKCYPQENLELFEKEFINILKNNYDIIELHTSYWKNTVMEEIIRRVCDSKIIVHAHATDIAPRPICIGEYDKNYKQHMMIRSSLNDNLIDVKLACSDDAAKWLFGTNKNIKVINNFIDINRYKFNEFYRIEKRQKLNIQDEFVIGMVGRYELEKNHKYLIEIASRLKNYFCNFKIMVIGDGSQKNKIIKEIYERNLQDLFLLVDTVKDTSEWYSAMDMFLLPSIKEAFGIVLLEAQANGLPCLCSTEIPSIVINKDYSKRLSLDYIDKWIDFILFCYKNKSNYKDRNILIDYKKFDSYYVVKKLQKIYEEIIL